MDIDIDFLDRSKALALFKHIPASRLENGKLTRHNTGVYFHAMPIDPEKNISAIPYDKTDNSDIFKIDLLNVSIYKGVRNEQHLTELMNKQPLWDLLEQDEFSNLLFHVNGHGEILRKMKPKSIEELAAVLAMIRPAKRYLVGKSWSIVNAEVWLKPDGNEYYFKKSHAIAYAHAIVVQMNLICEQVSYEFS
jgi:hypothetical protein